MYNSCHTRPQNAVYQHDQPSVQHATMTKYTNTQTTRWGAVSHLDCPSSSHEVSGKEPTDFVQVA